MVLYHSLDELENSISSVTPDIECDVEIEMPCGRVVQEIFIGCLINCVDGLIDFFFERRNRETF